jgi:hypothetical protein
MIILGKYITGKYGQAGNSRRIVSGYLPGKARPGEKSGRIFYSQYVT